MMKFQFKENKDTNTLNQVIINGINFNVNDKDITSFILDIIHKRPDILEDKDIMGEVLNISTYKTYIDDIKERLEESIRDNYEYEGY